MNSGIHGWLQPLRSQLGAGVDHPDALALALDYRPSCLITGDEARRRRAQRLGIPSIDAPHVIQLLAETKLIAAAKPHLNQMRQRGYGIPRAVYERILRDVGER